MKAMFMTPEFLSREIKVKVAGIVKVPVSFRLGERDYMIDEILETWADHSFGSLPPHQQKWWLRRHRNCYRVRTREGEIFEIYHDRGTSLKHPERKKWFLYRKLNAEEAQPRV